MISALSQRIWQTIERYGMLHAGDRLAVAVSGGADSVALLRLLHSLRFELGVTLCVVHFNHQLRGKESDADEVFVSALAKAMDMRFIPGRADVVRIARQSRWNLEDAGRRLRYHFFAEIVQRGAATRVATAHTADDQAETILARIVRGTGLTGLAGIYPVRESIIRPLLDGRRAELREYLTSIHQEWREDSSNADTQRLRARVRQDLVPYINQNFSNDIVRRLTDLANLARDDAIFWDALLEQACTNAVERVGAVFNVEVKQLLSPWGEMDVRSGESNPMRALAQRIIRKLHSKLASPPGELSQKQVEQVLQLAEHGVNGKTLELPGGISVCKEANRLNFTNRNREKGISTPSEEFSSHGVEIDDRTSRIDVQFDELGRTAPTESD